MADQGLLSRALNALIVFLMVVMVIMVFGNVVLRFGFHSGLPQSEELSRFAFIWLTFIAAVVGVREGTHLGMETVVKRLPIAGRKVCRGISDALMLVCCFLFGIGGYNQMMANAGRYSQASGFPLMLVFSIGLVASLLMFALIAFDLVRLVTGKLPDERLVQVGSGE
jgi:TRAP-type C4-dicarboxylate transport system permease small subunit